MTIFLVALAAAFSAAAPAAPRGRVIPIPGGEAGIRLDDYYYDAGLGRLVVPAGRTGAVALLDPASKAFELISGFAAPPASTGPAAGGPTSADGGEGKIFVTDRSDRKLYVLDAASRKITAKADLADAPDYLRYVAPTREVWVTEPKKERIEAFSLPTDGGAPVHAAFIESEKGEYEALAVDAARGRAYSNQGGETAVLDLKTRAPVARWRNGCASGEGLALDEKRGFLLVACGEGRVNVLDATRAGKRLSSLKVGVGVDIIAYWPATGAVSIPSRKAATVTFATLDPKGRLRARATAPGVAGGHCAASDGKGVYVCDVKAGALVYFEDNAR